MIKVQPNFDTSSEVPETFSSENDEKLANIAYPQILVSIKINL